MVRELGSSKAFVALTRQQRKLPPFNTSAILVSAMIYHQPNAFVYNLSVPVKRLIEMFFAMVLTVT